MNPENPFSIIKGKLPTQHEFSEWSGDKWVSFLKFFERFLVVDGNFEKVRVDIPTMKKMQVETMAYSHQWSEFMWRINVWYENSRPTDFMYRLDNFMKQALRYVKKNPSVVTPEMKTIMEAHPARLGKYLDQYRVTDSAAGSIIQRDTQVTDIQGRKQGMALPSIQAKMMTSLMKTLDIYEIIATSITKKDIRKMTPEDRISALAKIGGFAFGLANKKIVPNQFTQININGGVKDMESGMLSFVKKRTE